MTTPARPKRRWGSEFQLTDLLETSPGPMKLVLQDFALLTIAAQLSSQFPGQLVFKGGFVLRHVGSLLDKCGSTITALR